MTLIPRNQLIPPHLPVPRAHSCRPPRAQPVQSPAAVPGNPPASTDGLGGSTMVKYRKIVVLMLVILNWGSKWRFCVVRSGPMIAKRSFKKPMQHQMQPIATINGPRKWRAILSATVNFILGDEIITISSDDSGHFPVSASMVQETSSKEALFPPICQADSARILSWFT